MHRRFPREGVELTHILVAKLERARSFYRDVLGATVYREYEGTSSVLQFQGSWLLLVTAGGPTDDKPEVTLEAPSDPRRTSAFLNLRVADVQQVYEEWSARGAEFLTAPIDRGVEIRCYMRDPDGHLIEVGQSTGILEMLDEGG